MFWRSDSPENAKAQPANQEPVVFILDYPVESGIMTRLALERRLGCWRRRGRYLSYKYLETIEQLEGIQEALNLGAVSLNMTYSHIILSDNDVFSIEAYDAAGGLKL